MTTGLRIMAVLVLLAARGLLLAAVPGIPEPVTPGPPPIWWADWLNDAFGGEVGTNADDHRTQALRLGHRRGPWLMAIDHSILTAKQDLDRDRGTRTDELSLTLGRLRTAGPNEAIRIGGGVGLRLSGAVGGEALQNGWHRLLGLRELHLASEPGHQFDGFAWMQATTLLTTHARGDLPALPFAAAGRWGLGANIGGRWLTNDERQASADGRILLLGRDGAMWVGLRYDWRGGETHSHTATRVANNERGAALIYGATAGAWFVEASWNWETDASMGLVGWNWGRVDSGAGSDEEMVIGEIGLADGSAVLVGQMRWTPRFFQERPILDRSSLLVDMRFGSVDDIEAHDIRAKSQQVLLGYDWSPLAWAIGRSQWMTLEPMLQGGIGLRHEYLHADGPDPAFPARRAVSAVIQGSIGLRCWFGAADQATHTVRYGLAASYDAWWPWNNRTIIHDDQSLTLNRSGHGLSLRLMSAVRW